MAPAEETSPGLFFPHEVNNSREAIIDNIRASLARGLPMLRQQPFTDTPLAIVCGGPSLKSDLPILQTLRPECHVLAVNGAYKHLRGLGIEPEHFLLIDSRPGNVCHVDAPGPSTHHYLASQVHPAVFDCLRDRPVSVFHLGTDTAVEAVDDPDADGLMAPIGMASVHAVYIAAALGYRNLLLFGYDFSRGSEAYAYAQPMNAADETLEIRVDGKTFVTTLSLARTADQFVAAISPVMRACELNVQVFGEGLLPAIIASRQRAPDAESERLKYEQMWRVDAYRKVSPGLESVIDAVQKLDMQYGRSVADFGCGTGRCAKWFEDQGFDAVGVDIAGNALEEAVPFVQCTLWDSEKLPSVDYGFSVDVLEHIPTERVMDTLQAIHDACRIGCYLNIDTIPDAFGVVIGKTLHLTVQPAEWWEARIKAIWPEVDSYPGERQAVFVCRK